MITTKKIKLTRKEFFLILIQRHVKKQWWLFAGIWILAIIFLQNEVYAKFFIAFAIIIPIITIIEFWRHVVSKKNQFFLLERYYEIDGEKINTIIDRDSYSPIKLEHFIKVDLIRNTYLLFVSKNMFAYIPINSFKSDLDKQWFENEIIKKIKEKARRQNIV
jgi:hypothetical protein